MLDSVKEGCPGGALVTDRALFNNPRRKAGARSTANRRSLCRKHQPIRSLVERVCERPPSRKHLHSGIQVGK